MSKCDFCDKPMTCYGQYHSYLACDDHIKEGEDVEAGMWKVIEESQDETN